jgi:hypothetical protein
MLILPNETTARNTIRKVLAEELELCKDLLQFGARLPDPAVINANRMPEDTVFTVLGLFTKACVSYRSIIHLCEAGFSHGAAPIRRSLFETFLNLTFLVRRRVFLRGRALDMRFRTDLYHAFCVLRYEKMIGQWANTPGIMRSGKSNHRSLTALPQPFVDVVGPEWKDRLRNSNTCAGLSIADYSAILGKSSYMLYRVVYAMDSQNTHQNDFQEYLDIDDQMQSMSPRWHTSPNEVRQMLHYSSIMFLRCADELHKRFKFGNESKEQHDCLIERFKVFEKA